MIEINLLPEELKAKPKSPKTSFSGFSITREYFIYLPVLIFGILICTHIYLTIVFLAKSQGLRILENKWKQLEPQRKTLEDFNKEYAIFTQDSQTIQQLTGQRVIWSEKLNKLSLNLPSGIWFNEISITSRDFTLRGSVVSLQQQEMDLIKKFIDNLKDDAVFFGNFTNLELSSMQRRIIGGYDILDFVLVGTLKDK